MLAMHPSSSNNSSVRETYDLRDAEVVLAALGVGPGLDDDVAEGDEVVGLGLLPGGRVRRRPPHGHEVAAGQHEVLLEGDLGLGALAVDEFLAGVEGGLVEREGDVAAGVDLEGDMLAGGSRGLRRR